MNINKEETKQQIKAVLNIGVLALIFILLILLVNKNGDLVRTNLVLSETNDRVEEQSTLINEMTNTLVESSDDLQDQKDLAQTYLENASLIAAIGMVEFMALDDPSLFTHQIPKGNPFLSGQHWRKTASFGESAGYQGRWRAGHTGLDMVPSAGEWTVQAIGTGVVDQVGRDRVLGTYLRYTIGERIRITYAHLNMIYYAGDIGEIIEPGIPIAEMGNTGYSDGAHLHIHIEFYNGEKWSFIDPEPFLTRP